MRISLYALLLLLSGIIAPITTHGAPRPERPVKGIVLQDGSNAIVENGNLLIVASDGKKTPAPAGRYVTLDGRTLVVSSDGRFSANNSPRPSLSASPAPSSVAHNPTPAPSPVTQRPTTTETQRSANLPSNNAQEMANAQKVYVPDQVMIASRRSPPNSMRSRRRKLRSKQSRQRSTAR